MAAYKQSLDQKCVHEKELKTLSLCQNCTAMQNTEG